MTAATAPAPGEFAIVELMGHVRMVGILTEVTRFGSKLGQLDVIDRTGAVITTQLFGGASVYRITPCTEETAKAMARDVFDITPSVPWDAREMWRKDYEGRQRTLSLDDQREDDEQEQF